MKWESVQVGQVLQVNDDELFPADLLCLYTALPDKVTALPATHTEQNVFTSAQTTIDYFGVQRMSVC